MVDGQCQPFTSELDSVVLPNDGETAATWTAQRLSSHLLQNYGLRVQSGDVQVPAGGQSLLDLLDNQASQGQGVVWYVRRNPNGLGPHVRFMSAGSVPTDSGVDLDELPFVPQAHPPTPTEADRARAEHGNALLRRTADECLATVRAAIAANPDKNPETLEIHCSDYVQEQQYEDEPSPAPSTSTTPAPN